MFEDNSYNCSETLEDNHSEVLEDNRCKNHSGMLEVNTYKTAQEPLMTTAAKPLKNT